MATLAQRVSDLAGAVRDKLNTKLDTSAYIKGLSGWCAGKPAASEVIAGGRSPYAFTISQANSRASASVAATAQTIFTVYRNGVQIGTITFAAAATTGTISLSATTIDLYDRITVVAPATPDDTLADIDILLRS